MAFRPIVNKGGVMAMQRLKMVAVQRQFKHCPTCEYTEGFHVMFSREHQKSQRFRMYLICPMCTTVYDIGLLCETGAGG